MKLCQLLVSLILGASGVAAAGEDQGFYVGVGLGPGDANNHMIFALTDEESTDYRIFAGYELSRFVAAEVGYADFGSYTGGIPTTGVPLFRTRVALDGFSIGVRPQLALGRNWHLQAQTGVFFWESDAEISGNLGNLRPKGDGEDFYYGLGVARKLGASWRLSGEFTRFETGAADVNFLNLALSYRFGRSKERGTERDPG